MRLPTIQVSTTQAKIGLRIEKPKQEIQQPQATLNLTQEPAILEISRTPSKLSIDTTEARANYDQKSIFRRTRENGSYGRHEWLEGISRRVSEGLQLRDFHKKDAKPISSIAKSHSYFTPSSFPQFGNVSGTEFVKLDYQPSELDIDVDVRGKRMDPEIRKPIISYQPGSVEVYLEGYNSISFSAVGVNLDLYK